MQERFDAAFLFGQLGNLADALGEGWSVEDNYAWAIGDESRLTLPLPGGRARYRLRLTVRPWVHPGRCEAQRLEFATSAGPLASFNLDRQTTIELALPPEQTSGRRDIALILRHPDAFRPSDVKPINDRRLLSLCFMSGALQREREDANSVAAPDSHLIIAGDDQATQIAEIIGRLPALRRRVRCHLVAAGQPNGAMLRQVDAASGAVVCWQQVGMDAATRSTLRHIVPAGSDVRRFPAPRLNALWPFQAPDNRLLPESGRYSGGRYPFGDRIGASLANLPFPDDVLLLAYHNMAEKELPDLGAGLAGDAAAWRKLDESCDVTIADFILDNLLHQRLFFAPPSPTGALLRHMILQLLAGSPLQQCCDQATLTQELDFLLTGYLGRRVELPIHPLVARHFRLGWWQPDMRYRWHGNRFTYDEYALYYLRWMPWRR